MTDKRDLKNTESGMMVVEAVFSFTIFIMVCLAVVYLINIFTVHNKIQFAINSAAKQIASCTYLCDALGLRPAMLKIQADGSPYMENIDNTTSQVADSLNKIQSLYNDGKTAIGNVADFSLSADSIKEVQSSLSTLKGDVEAAGSSIQASASSLQNLFSDPNGLIAGVIYMAADGASYAARNMIGSAAASGLTKQYLKQGAMSADSYLKSYGIKDGYEGLDFSRSTMLCDKNMRVMDIVVEYDIDLGFIKLIVPEASVHMVQRVSVAAWVGGDDNRVSK